MSDIGKNYVIASLCVIIFFLCITLYCTYDRIQLGNFMCHYDDSISNVECKIVNKHSIVIYKILDNGKYEEYKELYFPEGNYIFRTIKED